MNFLEQQVANSGDLKIPFDLFDGKNAEQSRVNADFSLYQPKNAIFSVETGDNPAFDLIGLTRLREEPDFAGIDGSGFSVAIIDSGIDTDHPLLENNYLTGVDFFNGDDDPDDLIGHGTHVSGTIGARNESIGVAPDVGLIGLKVGEGQQVDYNAIVDALEWVVDNHQEYNIVAVNLSLGGGFYTSEDEVIGDRRIPLIQRLEAEGVVVVAAAGNLYHYKDPVSQTEPNQEANLSAPAIYSTLAVGAVWQDDDPPFYYPSSNQTPGADRIAFFSQRLDAENFLLAPGAYINSTYIDDDGFESLLGTSMASPHVAGAVALLQEAALQFGGRILTPDEIVSVLQSTADTVFDGDDEADFTLNTDTNYGRINVYNAVAEVQRRFTEIEPTPDDDDEQPISKDTNGTIAGAFVATSLDGSESYLINGIIGIDGDGNSIGDKDVDLFSFAIESSGTVSVELGSHSSEPDDFNTYLRLFDSEGNELASNDNGTVENSQFSSIATFLTPGTYYAGVSGYNNSSYDPNIAGSGIAGVTGNYSIEFSLNNLDPDGLISGAREINLGNNLEPVAFPGSIGIDYEDTENIIGESDVDLYKIVAPDNGILLIDIDTPYTENYVDSFLRLFDEEGNELFFASNDEPFANDDRLSFDADENTNEYLDRAAPRRGRDRGNPNLVFDSPQDRRLIEGAIDSEGKYSQGNYGHDTDSFLGIVVDRGDVYHIGVSDTVNQDYDPTNLDNRPETGNGGLYELIVTFANNDLNGTITQVSEQTNTSPVFSSEKSIGEDDERDVGDRDVDFWKINADEAGILEIDISTNSSSFIDTVATLFDRDGNPLATNDDSDRLDPLLRYQIAADTDYYVGITGYGNENFDPFALGSGSGGDKGNYTINSDLLPLSEIDNLSNNRLDSAGVKDVAIGEFTRGNIGEDNGLILGAEDIDLYRLISPSDGKVNIRVSAAREFSADTFLRLFDSEGNEIAFNNDEDNITRGSFLQQEVIANREYYIGINGYSDRARKYDPLTGKNAAPGSQGDYSLAVSYEEEPIPLDTAIYRFQNQAIPGTYIYVGEQERQNIKQNLPNFKEEGLAFKVATEEADNLIPIYRFQNQAIPGTYLFVGEEEKNNINRNFSNSFSEEGLAFYVYDGDEDRGTTLYRFQNTAKPGTYIFVADNERNNIINNFPDFVEEGAAFEVVT